MQYNYVTLYNKNAAFFHARPRLKKGLLLFNRFAPYLFATGYAGLLGWAIFKASPKELAFLLFTPACALLAVTLLRLLFNRARPYDGEGAGIVPLQEKRGQGASFPSRHLASAAVLSACFFPFLPLAGALGVLLTVGLGYARFAIGWHYPSDLFAGFFLGLACGGLLLLL